MKKHILIISLIVFSFSCRKNVDVKFPPGIYEFRCDMEIASFLGGKRPLYTFPVKLLSGNNDELKMQSYRIKYGSGDTLFNDTSIFYIRQKKYVEGDVFRGNSSTTFHFTNGKIRRTEKTIIGDCSFQMNFVSYSGSSSSHEVKGTYTFSKKE